MKTITLPTSVDELRNAIKIAIQTYSETPVKNDNKLNEALAKALDFNDYNTLSAALKQQQVTPYDIDFEYTNEQAIIINGQEIPTYLVHDGIIDYTIASVSDRIDDLRIFIAEALRSGDSQRIADVSLMQDDLDTLLETEYEYALEAYGTNGFVIAEDTETFNQICDELIETARDHFYSQIKERIALTDDLIKVTDYFSNSDSPTPYEISKNQLVLIESYLVDTGNDLNKNTPFYPYSYHNNDKLVAAYMGNDGFWHCVDIYE